jgi:hypothetical protein
LTRFQHGVVGGLGFGKGAGGFLPPGLPHADLVVEPAGEGGAAAARFLGAAAFNAGLFDSDASSDSDASYKQAR